ncbi:MAG TPA: GNAT family N-acetyltransferase [Spirochaetia bacterium]|nr:GNAT family N-acetyltransferase [Spirochaetia bacterium]
MNVAYVRLLASRREDLWRGPGTHAEELRRLREKRGEKIAAVDPETERLLGWISVYPEKDAGGVFFALAGIEVLPAWRGMGIGTGLVSQAGEYMREHKTARLKFGTSPLLTWNAGLYMKRFGMRYIWKEGVRTPDGKPWPYVSCEWDLDDPLVKPPDLRQEELSARSALDWNGPDPAARRGLVYSGPLFLPLPEISNDDLADRAERRPEFLVTMYRVFQELFRHGYRFGWFDTNPTAVSPQHRCFYFMDNPFAL